ncbi:MAG: DNA polymerase III subunit alpha [Candidatus Falkowbacteria bacterium]|nr:DNA polymerase III subunit alpha [Candidatus Falkowbacteria bacterium]
MSFVHLHVHSHYSLLDGLTKIDDLVEAAKAEGSPAVALTDHGVMYGVVEFYEKCKKAGIKPIIGVESYLAPAARSDKTTKAINDRNYYHLLLLAKNNIGYQNLIKLTSIAHLEGYYYRPRIDWEVLTENCEGLIATSSCLAGEIPRLLMAGKIDRAQNKIEEYSKLFGPDNFYLELQDHPELPDQVKLNKLLVDLAREHKLPLIGTNDTHYLRADDNEAQDILLCLQNKSKKEDTNRMSMLGVNYSLKSNKEMIEAFKETPEAITNTLKIAEACEVELELGKIQLPYFEVPSGFDGNSYLRHLALEGLIKRYGKNYDEVDQLYRDRLDYELSVVAKMGWPSYFLIVADFVNWSKDQGIVVGPGRGSAAGSLVCYLVGITNLCPIKYNLLFERFLNPDRVSMPDIDLDFADARRDEVLEYVKNKYGHDHVSQIITFGTMAARAAVRDVGRVLNYPYDYCDRLSKAIPPMMKIKDALERSPEFKAIYEEPEARRIVDYALKLEGVARHSSVHACGVLITKDPLTNNVPIQYASSSDRTIVSQYSLHPIEDLGLLKMDFLGLKNLTIIESAINIIKNTRGIEIDIDKIPLDDKKTYRLFQTGETTGVFQFESSGMKRYLKELKPSEFEDIIAMVALYRPGPMEWIPDYITGKHGKKPQYLHPKLEPILNVTYGVAVYQEQVMEIARSLAGFTMAEADVLRKAVGKKIAKLLGEQKIKFIEGCVKNGLSTKLASDIFAFIEPFAGYGFNRSHAACYAMIGYQTAYLKANFPAEFMAALLTSDQQDTDRIAIEIEECRHMKISIQQPDLNQSFDNFTVVTSGTAENHAASASENPTTIRFGLKAIKNVGEHISEIIIKERKANGPYQDIANFLERIEDKDLNRKSLESLIKSGGFDSLGERGQMLANIDLMINFHKDFSQRKTNRQVSLFSTMTESTGMPQIRLVSAPEATRDEKLTWEKELLGLYITEHPFSTFREALKDSIIPLSKISAEVVNKEITVGGVIATMKKILTRRNETMLFVKIEDGVGNMEVIVFPKLLAENSGLWQAGRAILCQGTLSDKDSEFKLLANKAVELTSQNVNILAREFRPIVSSNNNGYNGYRNKFNNKSETVTKPAVNNEVLKLVVKQLELLPDTLERLKALLSEYPGKHKVYLKIGDKIVETDFRVKKDDDLVNALKDQLSSVIQIVA